MKARSAAGVAIVVAAIGAHTSPAVASSSQEGASVAALAGYGVSSEPNILGPGSLRAGAARITTARDVDHTFVSPDIGLGATLLLPLGELFTGVDVDARYYSRPVNNGDNQFSFTSLAGYATVGLRF